jgi:peptide chain release factor 1
MKPAIQIKLKNTADRYAQLQKILEDPEVTQDLNRFRDVSREYSQLEPLVQSYQQYQDYLVQIDELHLLAHEEDAEIREMAKADLKQVEEAIAKLEENLLLALVPKDPNDDSNIFMEIRGGTGGDEAAIFAGDLCRMYMRFAEAVGYKVELISESLGEHGGYKEVILRILGQAAYSKFKFESGVHRVQRVPETEAQGRVHTSTCTIAILPEIAEIDSVEINPAEIRIDTFRASGAGGQHVQKTDSAIRITHIPTGTVVECQDERSQHKNKSRAMSLLKSRILAAERDKQHKERAETRRNLVGTGDRSERIRTYNFPQGRLTDHRINLTLYQLPQIMEGELAPVVDALSQEYNADLIASLAE